MLFPSNFTVKAMLTEAHTSMVYSRPSEVEILIKSHVSHEKMEFTIGRVTPWGNKSMNQCITVRIKQKAATQQQWICGALRCLDTSL